MMLGVVGGVMDQKAMDDGLPNAERGGVCKLRVREIAGQSEGQREGMASVTAKCGRLYPGASPS